MRDILILSLVLVVSGLAVWRPWVGVIAWTWISLMSPHRYAYGFAATAPVAMVVALATLVGLLVTRDRWSPLQGAPVNWFLALTIWITLSWLAGFDSERQLDDWLTVFKINFMIIITLCLIRTRLQINIFLIVSALSLALLGVKGGLFTLATGGSHRVWGPEGTFVGGNNEFALALIATIPLLGYMRLQMVSKLQRGLVIAMMILCAAAALGSQSRGALVAGIAMVSMLWWRGGSNRIASAVVMAVLAAAAFQFMPETWFSRMETIETYDADRSSLGRFSAWSLAWNASFHHFFGLGMSATQQEWFLSYSDVGLEYGTPVAHSIYFQMLGNHGFVGLALFLALWVSTWRMAGRLRRDARDVPQAAWCADLGSLAQVGLVGYLVGGAFLSLAYFDLPYDIMAMVVMTNLWFRRRAWETEPPPRPLGWGMWRPAKTKRLDFVPR